MAQRVRKAVLPVAGLGTRFLPATKAVPKELLTVVDRPLIQYAVEECLAAGIDEFVFVTGRNKGAIEDHFDSSYELEDTLVQRGNKAAELQQTQAATLKQGNAIFTRQQKPLGLGHAVWCARHWIGNEPFAVLLPDELTLGSPNCTARLVEAHGHTGGSVLAVMDVPREHTNRYGIAAVGKEKNGLSEITGMVEKPKPQDAPSTLALIGRYVLIHQGDPAAFIRAAASQVRSGGTIAFHEIGIYGDSQTLPALPLLQQVWDVVMAAFHSVMTHPDAGGRMVAHFHNAGLERPTMFCEVPVGTGPDSPVPTLLALTTSVLLPQIEKIGASTAAELDVDTLEDRLRDAMANSSSQILFPMQFCGWARV